MHAFSNISPHDKVCSRLAIRFLWVDVLCILQGDSRDWGEESQRLGKTFSGAHITICAASASSCQERFLQDRRIQPGLDIKLGTRVGGQSTKRPSESANPVTCRIVPYPMSVLNNYKDGYAWYSGPFVGDIFGLPLASSRLSTSRNRVLKTLADLWQELDVYEMW